MATVITRGDLHLESVAGNCIRCTFGDPKSPESEYVFTLNEVYLEDLVAGLIGILVAEGRRKRKHRKGG